MTKIKLLNNAGYFGMGNFDYNIILPAYCCEGYDTADVYGIHLIDAGADESSFEEVEVYQFIIGQECEIIED